MSYPGRLHVMPARRPTNAERAAWFREHDTSVAEQVSVSRLAGDLLGLAVLMGCGFVLWVWDGAAWVIGKVIR